MKNKRVHFFCGKSGRYKKKRLSLLTNKKKYAFREVYISAAFYTLRGNDARFIAFAAFVRSAFSGAQRRTPETRGTASDGREYPLSGRRKRLFPAGINLFAPEKDFSPKGEDLFSTGEYFFFAGENFYSMGADFSPTGKDRPP
jgi:hypothetical protein